MSKPFDASLKDLLEVGPADWPPLVHVKARSVEIIDADISTVTAATDKVLLVHAEEGDRIQHFDFQSGPKTTLPRRTHTYNALLENRHNLPVDSVVVLLARRANLPRINGLYQRRLPGETEDYLRFRYRVIRVWELPVDEVLRAGISVLPLAPMSNVGRDQLPRVIKRMEERFATLPDVTRVGELWTTTKLLMGLRYNTALVDKLLQGVRAMKESVTYQAIVEEGRLARARDDIRRIGERKFKGPPPENIQNTLESLTDEEQLGRILDRVLDVDSWEALIPPPSAPSPPNQGRTANRSASPRRRKKP